jgi:hypothetical protein
MLNVADVWSVIHTQWGLSKYDFVKLHLNLYLLYNKGFYDMLSIFFNFMVKYVKKFRKIYKQLQKAFNPIIWTCVWGFFLLPNKNCILQSLILVLNFKNIWGLSRKIDKHSYKAQNVSS